MSCPSNIVNITEAAFECLDAASFIQNALNCDIADNSPGRFKVNPTCLNRGTCDHPNANFQQPLPAGYPRGACICAEPDNEDNWAAKDDQWVWGGYDGDTCKDWNYNFNAVISYIIEFKYNDPSPGFVGIKNYLECPVGEDGNGADYGDDPNGDGWKTKPDLTPIAELMLKWAGLSDLADPGKEYGNYGGTIVPYKKDSADQPQHCKICRTDDFCFNLKDGEIAWPNGNTIVTDTTLANHKNPQSKGYLMVSFATDYNTYYDPACAQIDDDLEEPNLPYMPETWAQADSPGCPSGNKLDKGLAARMEFQKAAIGDGSEEGRQHHLEHWMELTGPADTVNVRDKHTQNNLTDAEWPDVWGLNWGDEPSESDLLATDPLIFRHRYVSWGIAGGTSEGVIDVPTVSPTNFPTQSPTSENCFSLGYTHEPAFLKFKEISADTTRGCRWGLKPEWEGGASDYMCDSPYVVCLPGENTPNNNGKGGFPMAGGLREDYKANDYLYTLDDCKMECAYDQRCVGFEFQASTKRTGACRLIDDVPMEVKASAFDSSPEFSVYDENSLLAHEDWSTLKGMICYEKDYDCNPYFTEDQLDDVMLQCYCPNNRKGFYTKNVVRTVAATKFCGSDPQGDITKRIREAQANRMFHLCENWCLFNTQLPRTESWYHDPWKECWREQYAGVGTHRSYCYRVIRDPYTIEQLFIDTRSTKMCKTGRDGDNTDIMPVYNTVDPSTISFHLADAEDSCEDACIKLGKRCNENIAAQIYTDSNTWPNNPFTGLPGVSCTEFTEGRKGWAHPSVSSSGECILRHPETNTATSAGGIKYMETTGCNVAIGVGYQRVCSCNPL